MPYKFTEKQAYHMKDGKRDYLPKKQAIAIQLSKLRAEGRIPPRKGDK
jgi:hypothetical protein